MGTHSHERANSEIYRALCTALMTKVNNPELKGATILRTELSPDGSTVCAVLSFDGADNKSQTKSAFNAGVAGFFRTEIAKNVKLRHVPKVTFREDRGSHNANRVEEILNQIHGGE